MRLVEPARFVPLITLDADFLATDLASVLHPKRKGHSVLLARQKPDEVRMNEDLFPPGTDLLEHGDLDELVQVDRCGLAFRHARLDEVADPAVRLLEQRVDQFAASTRGEYRSMKRGIVDTMFRYVGAVDRCQPGSQAFVLSCTHSNTSTQPSMSTTMTIRLEPDIKDRLEQLAAATHRSKSFLAVEAIRQFIELNEWQVAETLIAIEEADAGDFASEEEMDALRSKWVDAR